VHLRDDGTGGRSIFDHDAISHHDLISLFEHDLRANAWRLSQGKTAFHFSGSCSNGSMFRRFQPLGLRGQMTGNLLVQPTLNLGRNVDDFDGH
jgi:hypothetical protein